MGNKKSTKILSIKITEAMLKLFFVPVLYIIELASWSLIIFDILDGG